VRRAVMDSNVSRTEDVDVRLQHVLQELIDGTHDYNDVNNCIDKLKEMLEKSFLSNTEYNTVEDLVYDFNNMKDDYDKMDYDMDDLKRENEDLKRQLDEYRSLSEETKR